MSVAEVISLKEALYKQAHSIQELSVELEKERKAAASGADEALSMIFRLQQEKAAEKMKASQYKRITEAKLLHAEESMASLIEAVLEKEREIATLRFQLQSYRQNMQRIGDSNTDVEEIKTSKNNGRVRRLISVPSWFDSSNLKMDNVDTSRPLIPAIPFIESRADECPKKKRKESFEFFSNKSVIEEVVLDSGEPKPVTAHNTSHPNVRVDTICERDVTENCSVYSQSSSEGLFESNFGGIHVNSKCRNSSCSTGETIQSTSIQDIYEVPKSTYGGTIDEYCECDSSKAAMEGKLKTFTGSLVDDLSNTTPMIVQNALRYLTLEKGVSMNPLQSDFEQLKERVKTVENDQRIMKEEESKRKSEQLSLLRMMQEQMSIIQRSQTKVSKHKVSQQDDIILMSITEAILSFAL